VDEYSRFPFVIKCLDQIFTLYGMPSYIHSDRGASFFSQELKEYLSRRGIATSKTTPYHPIGNGQVERYNGIIWKAVRLSPKSANLRDSKWELVHPDVVFHSIRSLLSTNTTPHERFFNVQRRLSLGASLPSWLENPGLVLLRRFIRTSKNDPFVDQVELTDANPTYAHVKYLDGRKSSVSLRDLAPCPITPVQNEPQGTLPNGEVENGLAPNVPDPVAVDSQQDSTTSPTASDPQQYSTTQVPALRRSSRQVKPPSRYGW
jgi:hypothetical protein